MRVLGAHRTGDQARQLKSLEGGQWGPSGQRAALPLELRSLAPATPSEAGIVCPPSITSEEALGTLEAQKEEKETQSAPDFR